MVCVFKLHVYMLQLALGLDWLMARHGLIKIEMCIVDIAGKVILVYVSLMKSLRLFDGY